MSKDKQMDVFGQFIKPNQTADAFFQDVKASTLRSWYRRGQRAYRALAEIGSAPQIEHFNDLMTDVTGDEREGFLMGWQADAWAVQHGAPLAVEGATSSSTWRE